MSPSICTRTAAAAGVWLAMALLYSGLGAGRSGAQTPAIQIAGASAEDPLDLTVGCNVVVAQTAAGTAISAIAALVKPADALVSIWRYDNTAKVFRVGFFADGGAPVDLQTTGNGGQGPVAEAYYLCLRTTATVGSDVTAGGG